MKTIKDFWVVEQVPPLFPSGTVAALDLEMFGMKKKKLHRPTGRFASLCVCVDGCKVYAITDVEALPEVEEHLVNCELVFHNAMFDLVQLRRWMKLPPRDGLHDTMVFERVLYNGLYNDFGLNDLARRHLQVYMDKEIRKQFEKANELTNEMIKYNAIDTVATFRIREKQLQAAKTSDLKVWNEIDKPALWAFLGFKGPKLDVVRWQQIAEENAAKAAEFKGTFPFNPNAPAQVKKYLNETYDLNLENTNEKTIEPLQKKYPIIADLLNYREVSKRASTYGTNWIKNYVEKDGRVYPAYRVIGAETGRVATSDPTIQNIPVRDTPVYRECFAAEDGCILVGCDYGQQEVRIAAYLGKDVTMIDLFKRGGDIYADVATIMFHEKVEKKDPRRDKVKSLVLGIIYGMSSRGLAERTEMKDQEAEEFIHKFFSHFPGIKGYVDRMERAEKWVKTPGGRRCWLNQYSSQALRNARNSPAQGGGSDMIKLATSLLYQDWDTDLEPFPAILQVHDELVLEVKQENEAYAKDILAKCMIRAGEQLLPGVPVGITLKTGKTWKDIH